MRWFRSHVRGGSCLALFALALQLVVTFAHVHSEAFAGRPHSAASVAFAVPGPTDRDGNDHPLGLLDACSICSLIQLVASGAPASSPSLPLPFAVGATRLALTAPAPHAASHPRLFRARAPPTHA